MIASAPYFWIVCDDCGAKSTEGGDYSAWSDENGAWEEASNSDWGSVEGKHYCDGCFPKHDPDRQPHLCDALIRPARMHVDPEPEERCDREVEHEDDRCPAHEDADDE
ncbi:hypothetical protein SEA_RIZWANA_49 [Arthrobacter phage Rizwana]|nr:hypothetical protein SEA_RIZWANA_49 [Arthrobacter phage Rizwana]